MMYSSSRKPATEPSTMPATTPGCGELWRLPYADGMATKEELDSSWRATSEMASATERSVLEGGRWMAGMVSV